MPCLPQCSVALDVQVRFKTICNECEAETSPHTPVSLSSHTSILHRHDEIYPLLPPLTFYTHPRLGASGLSSEQLFELNLQE